MHMRQLTGFAFGVVLLCLVSATAKADTVVLTSGSIINIGTNAAGTTQANLTGSGGFTLQYRGDAGTNINAFTFSPLLQTGTVSVTFNGFTTTNFIGGGSFTNNTITGTVRLLPAGPFGTVPPDATPVFTVNFSGTGFVTDVTPPGGQLTRTFTITAPAPAPAPEPATLLLLGTGLAGITAKLRRRRRT